MTKSNDILSNNTYAYRVQKGKPNKKQQLPDYSYIATLQKLKYDIHTKLPLESYQN